MDLEEYRAASQESWDRIAKNWEEERGYVWEMTRAISERLVERAAPSEGETVLDLAAGTGDTGFLAAERVGGSGRLISTDFAKNMVDAARRAGEERGVANAEYRVLDAEDMDLEDDSVDAVVCRFGYMLMADPAAALAETRRVLRDGGRLAFAVWAAPDKNLWAAIPGLTLVEAGAMPPPDPTAPGIFSMADPERIKSLVTAAGFGEPQIEQVSIRWLYGESGDQSATDEHWEKTLKLAAPLADAVGSLSEDDRERVKATVAERITAIMGDDESGLDGVAHVVSAS